LLYYRFAQLRSWPVEHILHPFSGGTFGDSAMAKKELTFEDVEKHLAKVDLNALQAMAKKGVSAKAAVAAPAGALSQICQVWKAVGPVVKLIANIPFLPAKFKQALKILIAALDALCP
jgi:hypothetical protein